MKVLNDIEYYATPDGRVMVKEANRDEYRLDINSRDHIVALLECIKVDRPAAYARLQERYARYKQNIMFYQYRIVCRFLKCNFSNYDQTANDIDQFGNLNFELVSCPLRGECDDEGVICRPSKNINLTPSEIIVLKLIARGLQSAEIAEKLSISINTVNRHRENIKARLGLKSIGQLINYFFTNNLNNI